MCGIAGIVRYAGGLGSDRDARRLSGLRDRLRHRGPDDDGRFVGDRVGLVHTRLALLDPAGGAQPIVSPDGRYVLVYNGEVYNGDDLRRQLAADWRFRTRGDGEVVLAAFARWGAACLARLDGMFAFFVWDTRDEAGFAARDLLGVKPFVYAQVAGEFLFASEAKALLPLLPARPTARMESLLEYLVAPAFSGVERPLFDGLDYLPPGHCLTIARAGLSLAAWGHYRLDGAEAVAPAELTATLAAVVQRTIVADAPVGIFLSGGLDSTLLAALARRAGAALPAYTIGFAAQSTFDYGRTRMVTSDDEPYAARVAAELGLDREVVAVDRRDLPADLAALARQNDALPAWEQELAQHHLARAARRRCKAVLVGDAADETHYGYHFLLDEEATRGPDAVVGRFAVPIVRDDVLPDPVAHFAQHYRRLIAAAGHDWDDPQARIFATTWLIVHRWLPRLLHNGDIHTMAHSLEARVPFADRALVAVAQRVSPRVALRGGVEKALLREAARGIIPDEIRTRRKSALPKDEGVAAIYQAELTRALDDGEPLLRGVVAIDRARALCHPDRTLYESERALAFRLICLSHWARAYEVRMP